jgi:hypothetical protein
MTWKYGMIVVEIDEEGDELCDLVELYDLEGNGEYSVFAKAHLCTPEELNMAQRDVERDGANSWFFMNGDFQYKLDDSTGEYRWDWTPFERTE